ncbi:MAG: crotonase/enoyl-CoA hydratase family protein [Hyphomicrobiaceae bacterium]
MTGIESSVSEGIQSIRLTRAAKKNALTAAMYAALTRALKDGDQRKDVAVHVLLGSGGVFSAGSDIGEFQARAEGRADLTAPVMAFIRALPSVEKPLVAGVDGLATGIGTTMLLHCDLVYATPSAQFRTPFLDLGLVPEAGSSLLAPRVMGHQRAFELLALGEAFDAERAREAGIVNRIVASDDLEATVHRAAGRLAAKPPEALRLCRQLLRGDAADVRTRIEDEIAIFAERLVSPEAREAFAAFLEKRVPDFGKGRG